MKIKKYRPAFFEGFEDEYFDINSKEELLKSNLCTPWTTDGYTICFTYGTIMAIKPAENKYGSEWWVIAIIKGYDENQTLEKWLPDWRALRAEYAKPQSSHGIG